MEFMNTVWNRTDVSADLDAFFDAAKDKPQIVEDKDGHFILRFERGAKRPVREWATLPGTLEKGDEL